MKLIRGIKKFFFKFDKKDQKENFCTTKEREILKTKVMNGTDFAIREYGEVFKELAKYDRTLN
jgi:hypothetical protein